MSINVDVSAGGRGKKARRRMTPEINVTPLVDVMLVLLVIFMITIQAVKESIPMELPQASGDVQDPGGKDQIEVSIDETGKVHSGNAIFDIAAADIELPRLLKGHEKEKVTLNAHRKLPYETIVKVMSAIRAANIETVYVTVDSQ